MSGRVSAVSGGEWSSTGSGGVVRRVGVDARALRLQCTGVERMTTHFIRNLGRVAPSQEFVLFVDQRIERPAWLSPSCQMVVEPVRWPRLQKVFDCWLALQLPAVIRKLELDAFYAAHTKFPFVSIPRFTTMLGLEWRFCPRDYRLVEKIKQWVWFQVATRYRAGIVTFADHTLGDIRKLRPGCKLPICMVPGGIDPLFRRLGPDEDSADVPARPNVNGPYVLSVCSLEPRKNLDRQLAAFADIVQRGAIDHTLVLVGQPKWRPERLHDIVGAHRLGSRGCSTGYVSDEDLLHLYNRAELFVFPSKYEGFGLPVLKAMSCGIPVVTSRCSSLTEVAGDAAIPVDPYSRRDIVDGIVAGLTDGPRRRELIEAGFRRLESFSWERTARAICQFISGCEKEREDAVPQCG